MIPTRILEQRVDGQRLGRHIRHDPRSLDYQVTGNDPLTLTSIRHERKIAVLNQGEIGGCTGFATEGCVGTEPFFSAIPAVLTARPSTDPQTCDAQALTLYGLATTLDSYSGSYPPDDTGSDGLSVAKAAKQLGLISGYRHATSLDAALTALATCPVIAGINWYDSFDNPDVTGRISILPGAHVRGGHEIVMDEINVPGKTVWFTNSWGPGWGQQGRAHMTWETFQRLLAEQGDVTVFTPASTPPPVPAPPTPPAPEEELLNAFVTFLLGHITTWLKDHKL